MTYKKINLDWAELSDDEKKVITKALESQKKAKKAREQAKRDKAEADKLFSKFLKTDDGKKLADEREQKINDYANLGYALFKLAKDNGMQSDSMVSCENWYKAVLSNKN